MPGLIRKLHHFVFDGRAVPRTYALNLTAVERRAVNVFLENFRSPFGSVGDVTIDLLAIDLLRAERERSGLGITRLPLETVPVDRTTVKAGWCPGFQPSTEKT